MNKRMRIGAVVVIAVAVISVIYFSQQPSRDSQPDAAFNDMPAWQVIKEQDPAFHKRIQDQMVVMQKEGKTEQQIIDAVQPQILKLQVGKLQHAPDENVVEYMRLNMEQTAAMQKVSDDDCFRFLYPAVKGGVNPMRVLDKSLMDRRMQADVEMMRAAAGPDRHTVTQQERDTARADVAPIMQKLAKKYGDDFQLLQNPGKGVGKEKLSCDLVQDLWGNVLDLPEERAAGVIRLAVSEM